MSIHRQQGVARFLRFGIVGVIGFGVDVAVLYLLAPALGWYLARVLSFLAAATATWWLNRRFTFDARDSTGTLLQTLRQWGQYVVSMLAGAALNYGAYALTLQWLQGPYAAATGVALGSIAGLAVNFFSASRLIFKRRT